MDTKDCQTQIEDAVSTKVKVQQNQSQLAGEHHHGEGQGHQQGSKSAEEANRDSFIGNNLQFRQRLQLLDHQRTSLAQHIELEEIKRKWYYNQIDMITRKIHSLPVIDGRPNQQPGITRKHLEFEISRVRKIMQECFGTNEQIQQRRDAEMQQIQQIGAELIVFQQHHEQLMQQKQAIHMEGKGFGRLPSSSDTVHSSSSSTCDHNDKQRTMTQSEENLCEQHHIPGAIYNGKRPKGGLSTMAELLAVDSNISRDTDNQYSTRFFDTCIGPTNVTFGDGTNKALLCSMKGSMEALVSQLLSANEELCQVAASENIASPKDSPVRLKRHSGNFVYPIYPVPDDCRKLVLQNQVLPHSQSGDNALCAAECEENNMQCVARSGSHESVSRIHSGIIHDESHHASGGKGPMVQVNMGGSLDHNKETLTNHCGQGQRIQFDGRTERNPIEVSNSRILQVMQEVAVRAGINGQSHDCDSSVCTAPIPVLSIRSLSHPATQQQSQNSSFPAHLYGTPQQTLPYHRCMMTNIPQTSITSHLNITSHPSYPIQRNQDDNDEKPLDYSMKYREGTAVGDSMLSQSLPKQPMVGNFGIKQQMNHNVSANLNNAPVNNPCYSSQAVNNNRFGCHSAYAETDLDDPDPTTDYSTRYGIAYITEQYKDNRINYGASYNGSDPNCADCKLEEARRYNDKLEQAIGDDQIKTFCTEDFPNMSTATSLTDLSIAFQILKEAQEQYPADAEDDVPQNFSSKYGEIDQAEIGHERGKRSSLRLNEISQGQQQLDGDKSSRSGSQMTDIQTSTTVIANYHLKTDRCSQETNSNESYEPEERSFHDNRNDDVPMDHTKIYCEEGTPVFFSCVSSLNSLHSRQAADEHDKHQQRPLKKIEEKGDVMNNRAGLYCDHDHLHEHKDITKHTPDEVRNYFVEDTPICFSRCSSLSSISDIDNNVNRKPKETNSNRKPAVYTDNKLASKDESTAFKIEHTPICFSRNSSLTSLSVHSDDDDDPNNMVALLEDCINAALSPHTRSYMDRVECHRLSLSSRTEPDGTTSNKSGHGNDSSINKSVKSNSCLGDELKQPRSYYSRISNLEQTPKSKEEIFWKPTRDAKGQPCGRFRSQDSEKHLKDLSNQQIINVNAHSGSFDSLTFPPGTVVNTTDNIEKHQQEIINISKNLTCSIEHDIQNLNRSTDKLDDNESEKSPFEEYNFFMTCSGATEINVKSIDKQSLPGSIAPDNLMDSTFSGSQRIDTDGEIGNSSCETALTDQNIPRSLNRSLTVNKGKRGVIGMEGSLTLEDERALAENANIVMSEMMVNRMLVSGASIVDEENFIENETLALVANDFVSDTASEGSFTWSTVSDSASECLSNKTEVNSQMSRQARILKADGKDQIHYERETEVKAVRGKRKPLCGSKSVSSTSQSTKLPDKNRADNGTGLAHSISPRAVPGAPSPANSSGSRKTHNLRTMPQASSTPVKSNSPFKPCFNTSSPTQKTSSFEQKIQNITTVSATRSGGVSCSNNTPTRISSSRIPSPPDVTLNKTSSRSNLKNVDADSKIIKSSSGTSLDHITGSDLMRTLSVNSLKQTPPVNLGLRKRSSGTMVTTKQEDSLKQTVTSKFVGWWKAEKAEEKSKIKSEMQISSKSPVARNKKKNETVEEQEVKRREPSPKQSVNRNTYILTVSIADRVSKSSTYDKLNVITDKSQIPSHGQDEHDVIIKSGASNSSGSSNSSKTKSVSEQKSERNKTCRDISANEIGFEHNLDDAWACSIEKSIEVMSRSIEDNKNRIDSFNEDTVDTSIMDLTGSPPKRIHSGIWTKKKSHKDFNTFPNAEKTNFLIPLVKRSESLNFQTEMSVSHLYDYENDDNNVWIGQDDDKMRSSDVTISRKKKKSFGGSSSFLNVISKMFGVSKKSGDKQDKSSAMYEKDLKNNESNEKVKKEEDDKSNKLETQTSKAEAKLFKAEQKAEARQLKMQVKMNKSEIKASKKEAKLSKRRKSESSQYVDNTSQYLSSYTSSLKKCSRFD